MITSLLIFVLLSSILAYCCRKQLLNPHCHGFYRFFVFEGILLLAVMNVDPGNPNLFTPLRIASGGLMLLSLACVIAALKQLREQGGEHKRDNTPENFAFENTEQLVTSGIYHYIRHPMYSSLLLLNWGLYLQAPSLITLGIPLMVSFMLFITVKVEERENLEFFGATYARYQQHSRKLIPFIF